MEPVIRRADLSDIDQLLELLKLLFSVEADFEFDTDKQRSGLTLMLEDDNRNHRCIYVAEQNHEILGMCSMQSLVSTAEGSMAGLVEDMVVKKSWQRSGLGEKLLDAVCAWAKQRGIRRIQLLADKQNSQALNFYQKQGWQPTQLICLRTYCDFL